MTIVQECSRSKRGLFDFFKMLEVQREHQFVTYRGLVHEFDKYMALEYNIHRTQSTSIDQEDDLQKMQTSRR